MLVGTNTKSSKQITLKQVSEAAGVSIQTASQVLSPRHRSRYREGTRQRVLDAVQSLGYRPNAAARSMLTNRSHIIGVVVPRMSEAWFARLDMFEVTMGMNEVLAQADYVTSIIPVGRLRASGVVSRAYRETFLDGVVVVSLLPNDLCEQANALAPVVVWCDTNQALPTGCVRRDEVNAGQTVANRLIELGYKKFVWVTYAEASFHYSSTDRLSGITQVANAAGISIETVYAADSSLDKEVVQLRNSLSPKTAVITENHHFAQAVANVLSSLSLIPGRDYGLASCDHSQERTTVMPHLSRMIFDRAAIGEISARMLLEGLTHQGVLPESKLIQGKWFEGTTTRKLS